MSHFVVVEIDNVKPGMFVEAVHQQQGKMQIRTQGKINSGTAVAALKKKGIISFLIDPSRSDVPVATPDDHAEPDEVLVEVVKTVPFQDEISQADHLYRDAKSIQEKLLDTIQAGLPVDFAPVKACSDAFVESLQRNANALLCMSHIKQKDDYLLEHSLNVAILMATFAEFLGLEKETVYDLAFAGMLHDVGKIEVPDHVLHKPGKLTPDEMTIMQSHVNKGLQVVATLPDTPQLLLDVVGQHHEKLDGTGYPNGIEGSQLSEFGRMVSIIDAYDAMTADRCYKKGLPANHALKLLLKYSGTQFDEFLVKQFVKCMGVHPVGSLVRTNSDKIAMVMRLNEEQPLSPMIKVFYSLKTQHFVQPKELDLTHKHVEDEIIAAVKPEDFNINYEKFFYQFVCPGA